jgi:AraC family transcriptional regulator of adaptative response/methylated-DNA-[protein]-cysteine methyltransferase
MKTPSAAETTLSDPRWPLVLRRAPEADGQFLIAVKTTRIYCRPTCTARLPRPENVSFFTSPDTARAAGFRACLRCKPDGVAPAAAQAALIAALCRHLESSDSPVSLNALAERAQLSPAHLHRLFRKITGLTPKAWADAARAARVRSALSRGERVTDALYAAGFNSAGRFYAKADEALGMTPKRFRTGGLDTTIDYALSVCSLGALLVATSERGVCAIQLGDAPQALLEELKARFPKATLRHADAGFEALLEAVIRLIEAPHTGCNLPLDLRGTVFQQRVWQALRAIPAGSAVSYAEIARRVGQPKSSRAVAQACAANPVAVAVPCHRVVRGSGELAGYRWGVARKRALLEREARAVKPDE